MKLEDYKVVLYRQQDGSWVAEIPAIAGLLRADGNERSSVGRIEKHL
jgi:hypothetical protein